MKSLIATAFLILTITISAQNYKQISILSQVQMTLLR